MGSLLLCGVILHNGINIPSWFRMQDGRVHDSYVLRNSRADRRSCFQNGSGGAVSRQR